jgi:hypothetical protein
VSGAPPGADRIADWLGSLALLTSGARSVQELQGKIAATALALASLLPPAAFTAESLVAVARECPAFPSFAQLLPLLDEWWKAHRPPVVTLPPPPGCETLTPLEQAHCRALVRSLDRPGESGSQAARAATQLGIVRNLAMQESPNGEARASWERIARALIRVDPRYAAANGDNIFFVVERMPERKRV